MQAGTQLICRTHIGPKTIKTTSKIHIGGNEFRMVLDRTSEIKRIIFDWNLLSLNQRLCSSSGSSERRVRSVGSTQTRWTTIRNIFKRDDRTSPSQSVNGFKNCLSGNLLSWHYESRLRCSSSWDQRVTGRDRRSMFQVGVTVYPIQILLASCLWYKGRNRPGGI
jgi:hypothetical protein